MGNIRVFDFIVALGDYRTFNLALPMRRITFFSLPLLSFFLTATAAPVDPTDIFFFTSVAVPLCIAKSDISNAIEEMVPTREDAEGAFDVIKADAPGGEIGLRHAWVRDNLTFELVGQAIRITTLVYYRAELAQRRRNVPLVGGYSWYELGSCGYDDDGGLRRMSVGIEAEFSITPDGTLAIIARPTTVTALDSCKITIFDIDVTGRIVSLVQNAMNRQAENINSKLRGNTAIEDKIADAWKRLSEPVPIGATHWFSLQPTAIFISPLRDHGNWIDFTATLKAHPRIVSGSRPGDGTPWNNRLYAGQPAEKLGIRIEEIFGEDSLPEQMTLPESLTTEITTGLKRVTVGNYTLRGRLTSFRKVKTWKIKQGTAASFVAEGTLKVSTGPNVRVISTIGQSVPGWK